MALSYLCKELEKSRLLGDVSITAFVVDHKAREESSREAKTVSSWLRELGMYDLSLYQVLSLALPGLALKTL